MDLEKVDEIVDRYVGGEGILIQLLLDIQKELRWIPKEAVERISERLQVPLSQIYRVASFYKAMSLRPRGKHLVNVCLGTACQVRGAPRLLDNVMNILGIKPRETDQEQRFTLTTVNCLGCCALGPVMVVDGQYYSKPNVKEIEQIAVACE